MGYTFDYEKKIQNIHITPLNQPVFLVCKICMGSWLYIVYQRLILQYWECIIWKNNTGQKVKSNVLKSNVLQVILMYWRWNLLTATVCLRTLNPMLFTSHCHCRIIPTWFCLLFLTAGIQTCPKVSWSLFWVDS